jgi:cytochrome c-type biogenesis protein CcmH
VTARILAIGLLLSIGTVAFAIDPSERLDDPDQQSLYETITAEVRCLVCQNQPIADSTAPLAADLRREIRRMVEAGQGESEIKDFLVERYGDFILYKPRFESWTALLWIAPAIFLVIGVLAFGRVVAKRAQLPIDEDAP